MIQIISLGVHERGVTRRARKKGDERGDALGRHVRLPMAPSLLASGGAAAAPRYPCLGHHVRRARLPRTRCQIRRLPKLPSPCARALACLLLSTWTRPGAHATSIFQAAHHLSLGRSIGKPAPMICREPQPPCRATASFFPPIKLGMLYRYRPLDSIARAKPLGAPCISEAVASADELSKPVPPYVPHVLCGFAVRPFGSWFDLTGSGTGVSATARS